MRVLMLLIVLLWVSQAEAGCTGSGLAYLCSPPVVTSDVQTAINSASDGAVITVAPGSYVWGLLTPSMTKAVTLICQTAPLTIGAATVNPCTLTPSNSMVFGWNASTTGTTSKLYRFSGFQVGGTWNNAAMNFWGLNPGGAHTTWSSIRIDHNTFTNNNGNATVMACGDNASYTYCFGVIDHNLINSVNEVALYLGSTCPPNKGTDIPGSNCGQVSGNFDPSPQPNPQGQSNNMFVEDNILNVTTMTTFSAPCMSDSSGEGGLVLRYNTSVNCIWVVHELTHPGPQNWEVYNNNLTYTLTGTPVSSYQTGTRMIHDQGAGMFLAFNNTQTVAVLPADVNGSISAVDGYVDATCTVTYPQAYPCRHQPGRDWAGVLHPMYGWNNRINGQVTTIFSGATSTYVALNRDYYQEVSPFNGTVGVGFGLLANRPATCTHSNATFPTLAGDGTQGGVGYFATNVGAQGTLYRCSATNTWTVEYTPYTYPHPLVGGAPPDTTPPAAPTGVTISRPQAPLNLHLTGVR